MQDASVFGGIVVRCYPERGWPQSSNHSVWLISTGCQLHGDSLDHVAKCVICNQGQVTWFVTCTGHSPSFSCPFQLHGLHRPGEGFDHLQQLGSHLRDEILLSPQIWDLGGFRLVWAAHESMSSSLLGQSDSINTDAVRSFCNRELHAVVTFKSSWYTIAQDYLRYEGVYIGLSRCVYRGKISTHLIAVFLMEWYI